MKHYYYDDRIVAFQEKDIEALKDFPEFCPVEVDTENSFASLAAASHITIWKFTDPGIEDEKRACLATAFVPDLVRNEARVIAHTDDKYELLAYIRGFYFYRQELLRVADQDNTYNVKGE